MTPLKTNPALPYLSALMLVLTLASYAALGQEKTAPTPLPPGYYLVVAAYFPAQEDFVQRFTNKINQDGYHATYGFDPGRRFWYVYLERYTDFTTSINAMLQTRGKGVFPKAWIRIMKGQGMNEKLNVLVDTKTSEPAKVNEPAKETQPPQTPGVTKTATDSAAATQGLETAKPNPSGNNLPMLARSPVFLSLFNPTNDAVVEGDVEIVDTEGAKLLIKAKGNDYVNLPDPKNKTGKLTMIGSSFGFRKEQLEVNYNSTEADTLQPYILKVDDHYVIRFEMIRLHKGDIETLYNVYFYNDAAVMLPDSKYQLGQLLAMMNENQKYRIRLHGHTNGRAAGKVITMGDSKNFFVLTADVKNGLGSAKDLSRERAEVIRDWLIVNGISSDRMEIKAWGGNRMIHDKNSAHARKNVRVEVEIIDE